MPKIIENLREQLLEEAKRQIMELGYAQTTVRSVASACNVGVGTVYNYFKSKEMLVATFVYEEWKKYLQEMAELSIKNSKEFLKGIYDALRRFEEENKKLFSDTDAAKLVAAVSDSRHKMLREQIAAFILPLCEANNVKDAQFTAEFVSESIICWSMENQDFNKIYPLLEKIIK